MSQTRKLGTGGLQAGLGSKDRHLVMPVCPCPVSPSLLFSHQHCVAGGGGSPCVCTSSWRVWAAAPQRGYGGGMPVEGASLVRKIPVEPEGRSGEAGPAPDLTRRERGFWGPGPRLWCLSVRKESLWGQLEAMPVQGCRREDTAAPGCLPHLFHCLTLSQSWWPCQGHHLVSGLGLGPGAIPMAQE